jgi:aminoglycoside phosphotransferase family enzyme
LAFDVYRRSTSDHAPPSLVAFYRSRRACLRAKLAIGHLQDPSAPVPSPWLDRAAAYLALARRYADAFRGAA